MTDIPADAHTFCVHGPHLNLCYWVQPQQSLFILHAIHNGTEVCVPASFPSLAQAEAFCAFLADHAVFPSHVAAVLEDFYWEKAHPDEMTERRNNE